MPLRSVGLVLLAAVSLLAIGAPVLAPHAADRSFPALLNAPPTVPHTVSRSSVH